MLFNSRYSAKAKRLLYLWRAVEIAWHSSHFLTIISLLLLLVQGILPLVALYLTKKIIDSVTFAIETKSNDMGEIIKFIIFTAIIALIVDLARSLSNVVNDAHAEMVTDDVQNLLHQKSLEVDLEYYENNAYYDALHRAQSEAPYRPKIILNHLIQLAQSTISLSAIVLFLLSLHWIIVTVLFLAILPSLLIKIKYADKLYRRWRQWTPQQRLADYLNRLITHETHAKEIRLFNLGTHFQQKYRQQRTAIREEKITLSTQRALAEVVTQWSGNLAIFASIGFIAYQTVQGKITIGSLVMYYQAFQKGQSLLKESLSSLASLYENSLFLTSLYDFLDLQPKIKNPSHPFPFVKPLKMGIEFHNVQFCYGENSTPILKNLNFKINPGETIALVGKNGAGKSSLIKLLCRLYDPTEGKITIDGVDLRDFDITSLRENISAVFQDYAHYNLTVKENIGVGDLRLLEQPDKITEAVYFAGMEGVIEKFPHNYETILGHQFAQGQELSIGEWQKIAIARAYLRKSAILILDEPTSALDPQAEADVLSKFFHLAKNRTTLIITHRLSSVKLADRIFILEDGHITESGTHQELIKLQGRYAQLFATQAEYYR